MYIYVSSRTDFFRDPASAFSPCSKSAFGATTFNNHRQPFRSDHNQCFFSTQLGTKKIYFVPWGNFSKVVFGEISHPNCTIWFKFVVKTNGNHHKEWKIAFGGACGGLNEYLDQKQDSGRWFCQKIWDVDFFHTFFQNLNKNTDSDWSHEAGHALKIKLLLHSGAEIFHIWY